MPNGVIVKTVAVVGLSESTFNNEIKLLASCIIC